MKRGGDLSARYGGEEFALVLRNTDSPGSIIVAERIRRAVEALGIEHSASEAALRVTVSLGVSTIVPAAGESYQKLIDTADKALYQAKSSGRNCWSLIE